MSSPQSAIDLHRKIPIIDRHQYAEKYRKLPVDRDDPRFREPLVPLESVGVAYESYYAKTDGNNPPYCQQIEGSRPDGWLRKSLAEKLASANETLRPFGVELFVLDAYRPIACQRGMWKFHYADAQKKLPDASEEAWRKYALGHASPGVPFDPEDSTTWLPHTTGAAIDTTLRDLASGAAIDMGSNFEEIIDVSCTDYFERQWVRGAIGEDDSRLRHRRLLYWALHREGIVNDPLVYWHYDWGNQLYLRDRKALFGDAPKAAWYGYVESP